MHFQSVALSALLATSVAAKGGKKGKKGFHVNAIAKAAPNLPPPAVEAEHLAERYSRGFPNKKNHKRATVNRKAVGTTSATPYNNEVAYLVPVYLQGKRFDINMDTGSTDFWVYSDLMPQSQQKLSNGQYRSIYSTSTAGSSRKVAGAYFDLRYGDGTGVYGPAVYKDTATVGVSGNGGLQVTNQWIGAINQTDAQTLKDQVSDGVMGLGLPDNSAIEPNYNTPTFFDNVLSQLSLKSFAVAFKKGAPGSYDFGQINTSKYQGTLAYSNVVPRNGWYLYWMINQLSIAYSSYSASVAGFVAVDTGSTLTYLPKAIVDRYWQSVTGATYDIPNSGWVFPCNTSPPPFKFNLPGVTITMSSANINLAPLPTNSSKCLGGIQYSASLPAELNILGATFLKSAYVVFDKSQSIPRVGFAQQR